MKTPREVLKKLVMETCKWHALDNGKTDRKNIDQALKELDSYCKSKVPKKKEIDETWNRKGFSDIYYTDKGYNQAIDDMNK